MQVRNYEAACPVCGTMLTVTDNGLHMKEQHPESPKVIERPDDNYIAVITARGKPFNVRLVKAGDGFGSDRAINYQGEPMVEWYDPEAASADPLGRLITRQFVTTLLSARENLERYGLKLAGEGSLHLIDPDSVNEVMDWLIGEEV